MQKILIPVLVALALAVALVLMTDWSVMLRAPAHAATSPEDLAQLTFRALQEDDFSIIAPSVANAKDLEATFARASGGPDAARARADQLGGVDAMAAKTLRKVESTFMEAREKGAKEIDWKQATYAGLDTERSKDTDIGGIRVSDVEFLVDAGGQRIPIRVQQVFRGDARWAIVGGLLYRPVRPGTHEYKAVKTMERIASAVGMHRSLHKELPASLQVLREDEAHIGKPLLARDPIDPWGRPYVYERNEDGTWYVASYGPDALPNTDDDLKFTPR